MNSDSIIAKVSDSGKKIYGDVLIVEDNTDICDVVESFLSSMNCFRNIIVANDGVAASMKLSRQKFCLILMDLKLPKRTGEELIEIINNKSELNSPENVMIMSGTVNARKFESVKKHGVTQFILKPFDKDSFIKKIEKFLEKKKPVGG